MLDGAELLQKILANGRVPTLPDTALRLVELNNDPDVYPAQLQAVLGNDPALAGRIMQVANSAMFARQRGVQDLGEALALLGVRVALNMSLGLAIVDGLRAEEAGSFDFDFYWRKSVLGAIAANELYTSVKAGTRGELFLAALLQDVGMLALLTTAGEKYARLSSATRNHLDLVELERRAFGLDHADVGAALANRWQLPDTVCRAISNSHQLLCGGAASDMDGMDYGVSLAGTLAELWIAQCADSDRANLVIAEYLSHFGEDQYRDTVSSVFKAIPAANQVFNIQLLSEEQIRSLA